MASGGRPRPGDLILCEPLDSDGMWTKRGPDQARLSSGRALRSPLLAAPFGATLLLAQGCMVAGVAGASLAAAPHATTVAEGSWNMRPVQSRLRRQ
jgi:hypothetical protein